MHQVKQFTGTQFGVSLSQNSKLFHNRCVGLPGKSVRSARSLVKATVTKLLESIDLLMGCLPRDAKPISQFGNGVVDQLIVFDESLSLFTHGNTFPRHGLHLLYVESVTHVLRICVTYVLRIFCNLCPGTVHTLPYTQYHRDETNTMLHFLWPFYVEP